MAKNYRIEWDESLNTEIPWIDNQHKELLERVCTLLNVIASDDNFEEVGKAIKFLKEYSKSHFETEEKYMSEFEYPDYVAHIIEHENFIDMINNIDKQHESSGSTKELAQKLTNNLWKWFKNHIKEVDQEFGLFLKNKNVLKEIKARHGLS